MDTFPHLKSGAIAQFGSAFSRQYRTDVLTYIDGSEQRIPNGLKPVSRWTVRLKTLSAAEATSLLKFFEQQRGRGGTFLFIDPWGGTEHVCCFDRDATITRWKAEANIETELVIREVAG